MRMGLWGEALLPAAGASVEKQASTAAASGNVRDTVFILQMLLFLTAL